MLDPNAYDSAEQLAKERCGDWPTLAAVIPHVFNESAIPVRVSSLPALSYVISAMDWTSCDVLLQEIRGARRSDVEAVGEAAKRFMRLHRVLFGSRRVQIPVTRLLYSYLIYRKIRALPAHASVLDIGPADSYLSFFLATDPSFEIDDKMEVTQSLYLLQSAMGAHLYDEGYLDLARDETEYRGPVIRNPFSQRTVPQDRLILDYTPRVRSTLYPWWRFKDPFQRRYDVIMANENICEMSGDAFTYYMRHIASSLTPEGLFFVHGIGRTTNSKALDYCLKVIEWAGLRPVIWETTPQHGGTAHTPNLLFIGPQHPQHGSWSGNFRARRFNTDDPIVRAAFGLDEPPGEITDHNAFVAALRAYLAADA